MSVLFPLCSALCVVWVFVSCRFGASEKSQGSAILRATRAAGTDLIKDTERDNSIFCAFDHHMDHSIPLVNHGAHTTFAKQGRIRALSLRDKHRDISRALSGARSDDRWAREIDQTCW